MARNTIIFVFVLTIIAVLLTGINIGRKLNNGTAAQPSPSNFELQTSPGNIVAPIPTTEPTPTPVPQTYHMEDCAVSFMYDPEFTIQTASQGARLTDITTSKTINVACTDEIPKPPLPKDKIETITVGGVKTKLYHDASAKDGEPIDVVIVKHPSQKLEIGFFGIGNEFSKLLDSVKFLE